MFLGSMTCFLVCLALYFNSKFHFSQYFLCTTSHMNPSHDDASNHKGIFFHI